MEVHGAWLYFHENGIRGIKTNNAKAILGLVENDTIVHVDVVGAFYNNIRDHFMTCISIEDDNSKKIIAANNFFEYASLMVNKASCILYSDGSPTVERTFGSTTGIFRKLENQDNLEIIIPKYLISPSYQQY